ncbi:MAG TPA: DNA methyltransferase [Pyrinomonadaceae bacterium]|nr:DNA methyltransferase [Pyrinomonadaceae bacterium]
MSKLLESRIGEETSVTTPNSTLSASQASPSKSNNMSPVKEARSPYTPNLFPHPDKKEVHTLNRTNMGTFQDSLRAPVHRWFTYPAGFSYRAVEEAFRSYHIKAGMTVYDPFAGTGTTNVVAKQHGVNSFGVEAHPFIQFVARTKLFWEFDFRVLLRDIDNLIASIQRAITTQDTASISVDKIFPELVCKCYRQEKLARLYLCREAINALPPEPFRDFAKLGLTNLLRSAADVATGWPYIAPKKQKNGNTSKASASNNVVELLRRQLYQMHGDLQSMRRASTPARHATLISGDSRQRQDSIESESVDLAFTSPPYLNNYDYADRTRLETYFWGEATTWGDITQKVRTRLIMSATTQINRKDFDEASLLSDDFRKTVPQITDELSLKANKLSGLRLTKGGKKSYDIMVAGYFNDMLRVVRETFRVLKPGGSFVLILGDSAPYGVYIPTDTYLGEIGKAVGFAKYDVEELRARGGKWKDNPQRHDVALKECILTLYKE